MILKQLVSLWQCSVSWSCLTCFLHGFDHQKIGIHMHTQCVALCASVMLWAVLSVTYIHEQAKQKIVFCMKPYEIKVTYCDSVHTTLYFPLENIVPEILLHIRYSKNSWNTTYAHVLWENIARGLCIEENIALGFTLFYISLSTMPFCNISHSILTVVLFCMKCGVYIICIYKHELTIHTTNSYEPGYEATTGSIILYVPDC